MHFVLTIVFALTISATACAVSLDIPSDASFDELISTSRPLESDSEFSKIENQLWQKYAQALRSSADHARDISAREIKYGNKVMRYSFEQRGAAGANGFPLYIALHGGGAAGTWLNDSQWEHMKVYYRDSVDNGIYVATRGVTDTWNLHSVDESYPLYDRLITDLIAFANVDPNRVYIMGFSAGGDGVYQIGPRMPDRFAAANMSAGHNNWIRFDNLYNLPFLMQVGSNDRAYSRNRNAPENTLKLNELAASRGGYKHEMFLHSGGSHNSWRDNDVSGRTQTVITNLNEWLAGAEAVTAQANTNAVHWLMQYERNPYPGDIYWDYEVNALRDYMPGQTLLSAANQPQLTPAKKNFYWLSVLDGDQTKANLLHAHIDAATNEIKVNGLEQVKHLRILLRPDMINFDKPVSIFVEGQQVQTVTVKSDVQVMARTLLERGDRNYIFSAQIDLKMNNGTWVLAETTPSYTYCSKGSCKLVNGPQQLFFGPLPQSVTRFCTDSSIYALTFDDGPTEKWDVLLPLLEQYSVKATFFVNGQNINSPEQEARIVKAYQAGHQIANHSQHHRNFLELDAAAIAQELDATRMRIVQVIGEQDARAESGARIVRAPFGYSDQRVVNIIENAGYQVVRWNSDRYDWELKPEDYSTYLEYFFKHLAFIDANATPQLNTSMIDVNHDRAQATLDSLPTLITTLLERGYRFVTVSECMGRT
jgi:peptidoglycan/xylan/chitin deacetylase (PgdA/CDA1 family)/poly(3-hydroxybutyrate) depolymerase